MTFLRTVVATGIMAAVLLLVPRTLSYPLQLALYPPMGVAIYVPTIYLLGEFDRGELSRTWRFVLDSDSHNQ
jgi:hypothetical protein